jgi:hypothetical protein
MNQKWLFDKLNAYPQLMTNSTVLASFFTNYSNGIIGNISNTELAMATLFDFKGSDSGMIALYNEAIMRNNEIAGTEVYETNEAAVNLIALHLARFGKDSLTETEQLELEVLSNTCPFAIERKNKKVDIKIDLKITAYSKMKFSGPQIKVIPFLLSKSICKR